MMTKRRSRDSEITAEELMASLEKDPEYLARVARRDREIAEQVKANALIRRPVLDDLRKIGIEFDSSLDRLPTVGEIKYEAAIPITLSWLNRIQNTDVLDELVRSFSVPWARDRAEGPLIDLFLSLDGAEFDGVKWAIGNALNVIATERYLDRLLEIACDRRHGTSRRMLVMGLGKLQSPRIEPILIDLLADPDVARHAKIALKKLRGERPK